MGHKIFFALVAACLLKKLTNLHLESNIIVRGLHSTQGHKIAFHITLPHKLDSLTTTIQDHAVILSGILSGHPPVKHYSKRQINNIRTHTINLNVSINNNLNILLIISVFLQFTLDKKHLFSWKKIGSCLGLVVK
ncbi:hypothetical protein ACJX0J_023390 [Zea mays]